MSHLSGALKALMDRRPGLTQKMLADGAKVSQGQFSKYINEGSRPDPDSIEKLCASLPEEDRGAIAAAFARDCVPKCARSLVTVLEKKESARVFEEPTIDLPRNVREAYVRLGERARDDSDTADWLVGIDRILQPVKDRVLYEEVPADSKRAPRAKQSSASKAGGARSRSKAAPPDAHR